MQLARKKNIDLNSIVMEQERLVIGMCGVLTEICREPSSHGLSLW